MAMIKCPECRHHISSMAKACPECGFPIDPEWAEAEVQREQEKLQEIPFTVVAATEEISVGAVEENTADEESSASGGSEENDVPADSSSGKGSGPRMWLLVLIILLGLCTGGLYYCDYDEARKREQHAYELLKDCSNPDFYEDFIIRFPKSRHIDEVRERYKEVSAQQAEWQKLVDGGSRDELLRYLQQHPNGRYAKVAEVRIDSLDWQAARERRTLEAVAGYIAAHPEGYYIDEAETLRQMLERQRAEAEAAMAALRDSLAQVEADSLAAVQ